MPNEYALAGEGNFPQVEPEASYWFRCPVLCVVSLTEVAAELKNKVNPYPTDATTLKKEIKELKDFYNKRNDDYPQNKLSIFLKDEKYTMSPPVGSVVSAPLPNRPFIRSGLELATLFEGETPGLWHRHVMNVLLDPSVEGGLGQKLSPPLQSLLWAALDLAITSALMAAWHYKWLATDAGEKLVARRQRPVEYDKTLPVLFNFIIQRNAIGELIRNILKTPSGFPSKAPGTPRHPAYPSGHSTYSAAASTVMECFFGKLPGLSGEFNKLARNIGEARLWGGVHWRSDDEGRKIGNAVGKLIKDQLKRTGIYDLLGAELPVPDFAVLKAEADTFAASCGTKPKDFCGGLPKKESEKFTQNAKIS